MIPCATQDQATEVLRQVFSDICGPIKNPSIEGYWYFITFTDDFSQYTHVGLCKSKDGALPIFKWWKACVEKETGKVLKILCMDSVDREMCSAVHYQPKQPKTLPVLNRGAGETEADLCIKLNRQLILFQTHRLVAGTQASEPNTIKPNPDLLEG